MKSYEFTAKNIEKAIEKGLSELKLKREDVDIKIISEGGFFSKAKIEIIVNENNEIVDQKIKPEENLENENSTEQEKCCCGDDCCCDDDCNCNETCDCGCQENHECSCGEECHCHEHECDCDCECEEVLVTEKPEREYLTSEQVYDIIQSIFNKIFSSLNIDGKVMILENDDAYEVKVMGDEKVSSLIGFRGEGLNAYQFLINNFLELRNKSKKIYLDVENYRNKREESLKALAVRIAKKVLKTKRKHKFEPMTAYERHVIHEELSNFKGVTTHSEGNEPHRCLVVDIDKSSN